jgi:hypothetical protein
LSIRTAAIKVQRREQAAGRNKDQSYSGVHFYQDWTASTKAGAARESRLPDQLWALSLASVSIISSPPSLPQKHVNGFFRVFERFNVLKRLLLLKQVGLKPTR